MKSETSVLEMALEVAGEDRSRDYGHPLRNHERIANFWNTYLAGRSDPKSPIGPEDVAYMMILLKIAREQHTHKLDNLLDICGYVRCIEMMKEHREETLLAEALAEGN